VLSGYRESNGVAAMTEPQDQRTSFVGVVLACIAAVFLVVLLVQAGCHREFIPAAGAEVECE
jgi:hypothetical protein